MIGRIIAARIVYGRGRWGRGRRGSLLGTGSSADYLTAFIGILWMAATVALRFQPWIGAAWTGSWEATAALTVLCVMLQRVPGACWLGVLWGVGVLSMILTGVASVMRSLNIGS